MTESDAFRILKAKFKTYSLTIQRAPANDYPFTIALEFQGSRYVVEAQSVSGGLQSIFSDSCGLVLNRKTDRLPAHLCRDRREK